MKLVEEEATVIVSVARAPPATQRGRSEFSRELKDLAQRFAGRPTRPAELLASMGDRGFDLLLMMMALPFLTPIPLPGVSAPFGVLIMVMGAGLALAKQPWLPERLLRRELPARFIAKVLAASGRVARWLEILLRPRLFFLQEQGVYKRIAGVIIMLSGLLMVLPLPIPLTNSLPALTVVLLAAGAMERDGLFYLAGCTVFGVVVAYFSLLAFGGVQAFEHLWRSIFGS